MIKDKLKLENDLIPLDKKCESCGKFSHLILTCNHLQFKANVDKMIHEYNKDCAQIRQIFNSRSKQRTFNAVAGIYKFSSILQIIQQNTTVSCSQDKDRLEEQSSNIQNNNYGEDDSFQGEKDFLSQSSSIKKRNSKVYDKDVTILGKSGMIRTQRIKKPTLKITECSILPILEENKLNQLEEKMLESRFIISKRVSFDQGVQQANPNQNLNDISLTAYFGNLGSQQNISSNTNLPSPKHSQLQNNFTSNYSQGLENQSIYSKKIKNTLDPRVLKIATLITDSDNVNTLGVQENMVSQGANNPNRLSQTPSMNTEGGEYENEYLQMYNKKQVPLWFLGFDTMKTFKIYFPHNNFENVISKYNLKASQRQKKFNTPQNKNNGRQRVKQSNFNLEGSPYRKSMLKS